MRIDNYREMRKIILLVALTIAVNICLFAQEDSVADAQDKDVYYDSLVMEDFRFAQNLDSMLVLWYVEHSESRFNSDTSAYIDSVIPVFSDTVYKSRLAAIPSFVDLSYNEKVRAYIEVYTRKRRAQVEFMLGLSECYFPVFEEVLESYGIPYELKYLPVIESALNPRARSRAGAVGLWQFMYTTGKLYKLEINSYVDERMDIVKASQAAAWYLKDLYKIYNDWILVLAAYNCGPGNVNKAIRRSKGKTNYWELYHYLPRETRGYVPAFIAATYAMNYYKEHGLQPQKIEMSLYDTITITEELHLKQVSEVLGIPMEVLKDLNPQYVKDIIPATKKNYSLRLPLEYSTLFIDQEDSIYAYKDSLFFSKDKAIIPEKTGDQVAYVPEPPSPDMVKLIYTVKAGDNIGFISSWYGVNSADLRYWNNIRRNLIKGGQKLIIYKDKSVAEKYSAINTMTFEEKQKFIGKTVTASAETKQNPDDSSGDYVYYTVRSGDNFWSIAKKYPGVSNIDIMMLNGIKDERSLSPGQKLKIKKK